MGLGAWLLLSVSVQPHFLDRNCTACETFNIVHMLQLVFFRKKHAMKATRATFLPFSQRFSAWAQSNMCGPNPCKRYHRHSMTKTLANLRRQNHNNWSIGPAHTMSRLRLIISLKRLSNSLQLSNKPMRSVRKYALSVQHFPRMDLHSNRKE